MYFARIYNGLEDFSQNKMTKGEEENVFPDQATRAPPHKAPKPQPAFKTLMAAAPHLSRCSFLSAGCISHVIG